MSSTPKHNPLGSFLRARREQLGLSREKLVKRIHLLTGCYPLTANHYARIEMGRRMPSADTLDKIADGLDLDQAERAYLHWYIPEKPQPAPFTRHESVPDAVRYVLQFVQPASAYVIDRRMDILAWNETFCEIYGFDFDSTRDERERNIALLMFDSSQGIKQRLRDWEIHAQSMVAFARNVWASCRKDDKEIQDILRQMLTFPQFVTWWNQTRVIFRYNIKKEVDHPDVGPLALGQTAYQICDSPNLYMALSIPLSDDTENKLRELLRRRQQRQADRALTLRSAAHNARD